jgi:hypothetical protein
MGDVHDVSLGFRRREWVVEAKARAEAHRNIVGLVVFVYRLRCELNIE